MTDTGMNGKRLYLIEEKMTMTDEKYMRRALDLAANGMGYASPNPMVGAVIVAPDGRVIGEGWHRRCGEGHAEVNAVASVSDSDRHLLRESTMYVTLEPCAHYGKTPPCAELIIRERIPRVVVATTDPFAKVCGRGIAMLREAGAEVMVGMCGHESRELNRRFFTAHTLRRPFITLKWARSADGFMDWRREAGAGGQCNFSTPLTRLSTMRLRSLHDAVLTTAATVNADNARMTVRGWNGRQPARVVIDRRGLLDGKSLMLHDGNGDVAVCDYATPHELMRALFADYGFSSVLVESGPTFLSELIEAGLWDDAREEISPLVLGDRGVCRAPSPGDAQMCGCEQWGVNRMVYYRNDALKSALD